MRVDRPTSSLLARHNTFDLPGISAGQLRLDASFQGFSSQASDVSNLLAMTTGSFVYRLGRTAFMSMGLAKSAASLLALGGEVSAFRGVSNLLTRSRGFEVHEAVFDPRGWFTTLVHFSSLKGAGLLARHQNQLLTHTAQSFAMASAHQLTYSMDLTHRPHGSFLDQLLEAEITNMALNAGSALMGRATGHRIHSLERSLEAQSNAIHQIRLTRAYQSRNRLPALSPMRTSEGQSFEASREEAVNEFWRNQLEAQGSANHFFSKTPEAGRLFRALQNADGQLKGNVSQREYLDLVLKNLRISQGSASRAYATRYAVLEASERFDAELMPLANSGTSYTRALRWLGIEKGQIVEGLFERHLARYRVESRGGQDWGVEVNGGAPRRAVAAAMNLLPSDAQGNLLNQHEGKSLDSRLSEARRILDEANVRVVSVWGAGRHGLALGDWIRQSAQGEMIDGKYVIPVMLGHRVDFTHELNIDGTNQKNLPNIPINEAGRLNLRAALPSENQAYLALSETVIVTLPSKNLKAEMKAEILRQLSPNAQFIFAIKSVLDKGESVPGYVMESLAQVGRFDLMANVAFQSGLGFPKEMIGRLAPDAPVNLAVDAMNIEAALRAARTLAGDRAQLAVISPNKRSLTSLNKRIDVGVLVFKGAYGGFIKNYFTPRAGKSLTEFLVENYEKMTPDVLASHMRSRLAVLQQEAVELSESIFRDYEADAIRREVDRVERVLLASSSSEYEAQRQQALEWVGNVRRRLGQYRDRLTAAEDLLGCTRIRDMDVFVRIVSDLLNAKGMTFERRFGEFTERVRSQSSSGNLLYGLLEPVYLQLVAKGMLVSRPNRDFTVEGITGMPFAVLRWGSEPEFVTETMAWVHPAVEPRGQPALHASGLRRHAIRVTRDLLDEMEDRTHPIILNSIPLLVQRREVQAIVELNKELARRLRRENENFPPVNEEVSHKIVDTLLELERFNHETETHLKAMDYSIDTAAHRVRKYINISRRAFLELRNQLVDDQDWIDPDAMVRIRRNLREALQQIAPQD